MGLLDRLRRAPAAEAPSGAPAAPAEEAPEHRRITRPRGYRDTPAARSRLAEVLADQVTGGPWHVVAVDGGTLTITDDPTDPWISRPRARTVTLTADGVRSERSIGRAIELLAERDLGSAVAVSAERRRVITAALTPAHAAVRATVAHVLSVAPHAVEVVPTWGADEAHGGHLATVTVRGARSLVRDPARRAAAWLEIVAALPDGHDGWQVDDHGEEVVLSWAPPESLPALVPLDALDAGSRWSRVVLGRDPHGDPRGVDLTAGPHALVVGPTGSGKTIALSAHIVAAMSAGHDVVVGEAVKGGADFASVRPYLRGMATTVEEVSDLVLAAYAEGERRRALLLERGAVKWSDLPSSDHVRPLTVVLDEYSSLVLSPPVDKGLPEAVREGLERENAARALIRTYVGKIARELRFVGVHLVIAMQRADVASLGGGSSAGGGELRSNLSSGVMLIAPGRVPGGETLRMIFPQPEAAEQVAQLVARLDDGGSPGLAIVGGEGGTVHALRVGYADAQELPAILDARGVTRDPSPLPIVKPAALRGGGGELDEPAAKQGGGLDDALSAL